MKRIIGMAEVEGDSLHLAVFEIAGKAISLVREETLGLNDISAFPGLEVWLIVRSRDRTVHYVTLPKNARRQAREMAMMQASPGLFLDPDAYAYDVLLKPVGDKLGALLVVIPKERALAWESRLERAGLVLISFAIEPLFYPLLRPPQPGKVTFCMPTPQGSLAIVGCNNGTPVCWRTIQDASQIPGSDIKNLLVQEYFCEAPEPFVPDKVLIGEPSLEPRLVGYLAAAHLACLSPRPWEGRSILAFSDYLKREQFAPATWPVIAKCAALWLVCLAILGLAGIFHVRKLEREAESRSAQNSQLRDLAEQSEQAAREIMELSSRCAGLRTLTLEKPMALEMLRQIQAALPLRVRLVGIRYDAGREIQAECVAEREPEVLLLLDQLGKSAMSKGLRLVFAESREDGKIHFRIEVDLQSRDGAGT